jgi:hypothetical protein
MLSGYGTIARHRYILGIRYGIIKLYPTGKVLLDSIGMESAYLITGGCE